VDAWRFHRIIGLLALAQRLTPADGELHFQRGNIAFEWDRPDIARRELHTAAQISPNRVDIWITLAAAHVAMARRARHDASKEAMHMAVQALEQALRLVDPTVPMTETVLAIAGVAGSLDTDEAAPINDMLTFLRDLAPILPVRAHLDEATKLLDDMRTAEREREAGVMCWLLAQAAVEELDQESLYREALRRWQGSRCLEDVRRQGLHGELARVLMRQRRFEEAIAEAQRGIGADALSQWDHAVLGAVHVETRAWAYARDAYYHALLLDPDNYEHHRSLGWCLWNLALEVGDHEARCRALADAARHLENGLALSEVPRSSEDDSEAARHAEYALRVHYELGRIYTDADRFPEAIPHLLVAAASQPVAPLVRLYLGQAYRFADNVDRARAQLEEGVGRLDAEALTIGAAVGDECSRDWLLAWLHEELARVAVERDGDHREARRHLELARHHAGLLDDQGDAGPVLAMCASLQAKLHIRAGRFESAIRELQKALAEEVDAEFYVDLARAFEGKASFSSGADQQLALRRGRDASALAVKYDFTGRVANDVAQVRVRLDRLDENAVAEGPANGKNVAMAPIVGAEP
jgi:tetratricopeptide (TPR) repeat protein